MERFHWPPRFRHRAIARPLVIATITALALAVLLAAPAERYRLERMLRESGIAARGIHVDDVALVVHADPPSEHKAYLHRSGRTARAGAAGTVITLMTDQQVRDVRALTRAAGITPTTTKVSGPGHAILRTLAPGERVLVAGGLGVAVSDEPSGSRGGGNRGRRTGAPRSGGRGGGGTGSPAASPARSGSRRRRGGRPAGQGGQGRSGGASSHSASSFSRGR